MLDMIELGLVGYRGLEELTGLAKRVGSKPAFVFVGEKWGREEAYRKLQNMLLGELFLFLFLVSSWANDGSVWFCSTVELFYGGSMCVCVFSSTIGCFFIVFAIHVLGLCLQHYGG